MREREIQYFLLAHPEVLFPGEEIGDRQIEYPIANKRIDLLFECGGKKYIVEVKAVPVEREHIGQVIEYYGLMRQAFSGEDIGMILVAPSIAGWRKECLQYAGIRCVELAEIPNLAHPVFTRTTKIPKSEKQLSCTGETLAIPAGDRFYVDDAVEGVTQRKISLVNRLIRDTLPELIKNYNGYEIVPYSIKRAALDVEVRPHISENVFINGNVWFAFRFGFSKEMPPNDVPNISVILYDYGWDFAINAELKPSQEHMLAMISKKLNVFNGILESHGQISLKTYLKLEHQPRFYHWIVTDNIKPRAFDGDRILNSYREQQKNFNLNRVRWIKFSEENNPQLTPKTIEHMKSKNKNLNFAMRLVHEVPLSDPFWSMDHHGQVERASAILAGLKPLVDFFVK